MSATLDNLQLGVAYRIAEIVPHDGRMSLLDELLRYDRERAVASVTIRADSEFCVAGRGVPAWVGIEYMAQAVGAFSGIEDVQLGKAPQIGLLLGSRRYQCSVAEFPVGARLEIEVELQLRDETNLVAFDCAIRMNGEPVARADIKAVRPDNVRELIRAQS